MRMTIQTGEICKITDVRMAIRAQRPLLPVPSGINFEILLVMIKCRWSPCRRCMACLAIMAEVRGGVIGIGCPCEIRLMTLIAT
jgi:hypothetical protein